MAARSSRLLALAAPVTALVPAASAAGQEYTRTYRIGPIVIDPYTTDYDTVNVRHPNLKGSLTYMHARVIDARTGAFVPQQVVMLHHIAFVNNGRFDGDKSQYYCGKGFKE